MTELLESVLDAHGGLDRFQQVRQITVDGSLGGPFWAAKGWPGVYDSVQITIETGHPEITFAPYPEAGRLSHFSAGPERLEIRRTDGTVVEGRDSPRQSFPPTAPAPPWDAIQTSYFTSCACWNYFTEPFLFTYPGVTCDEIEPWDENGETWRRLAVHFPSGLPNHNPDQTFYYGDDFLLRRMDYHPEVTDALAAHCVYDYETFGGLRFPTRRRVYIRNPEGIADTSFAPITLDVRKVTLIDG
jgi:hypothetical protein